MNVTTLNPTKMDEINSLNIPAFKRKRSISAKEKRLASPRIKSHIRTTTRTRRTTKTRRYSRTPLEESLIDIPTRRSSYPSENLFPSPITDEEFEEPTRAREEVREMKLCGHCEGYFDKIEVAVILLTSPIRTGDMIIFETNEGLFEQEISSMQINRKDISIAHAGDDIGLKVALTPKVGGNVYKVI